MPPIGAAHPGKLAGDDLAFDFQADIEKENNHQPVVDPRFERLAEPEMVEPDGQMALKQVVIDPGGLRNVGQNQGQHRERDQNHAARPGAMHETVVLFVADKKIPLASESNGPRHNPLSNR